MWIRSERIGLNMRGIRSRMPSYPSDISHTGIFVVGMEIEDVLDGDGCTKKVAGSGMYDALGLTCGSRCLIVNAKAFATVSEDE